MYALFESYFAGTDRARFESDLAEKDGVILLRDRDRICGFSTFNGSTMVRSWRFFSGDTIVDREYWGETVLSRMWQRSRLRSRSD